MRILRFLLKTIFFLALALLIGVALVVFQMSNSSVGIGLLKPRVSSGIVARLPAGSRIDIGDINLSFAEDWSVLAEIDRISVQVPGRGTFSSEELRLALPSGSLLAGDVRPKSVSAKDAVLTLEELPAIVPSGSRAEFLRSQLRRISSGFLETGRAIAEHSVETIDVTNLRIAGAPVAKTGVFPDNTLLISEIAWRPATDDQSVTARFESDHGDWQLIIARGRDEQGAEIADIKAVDFPPAYIFPRIADPARRPYYDAKLTLEGRVLMDGAGAFQSARALVSFGPGYLSMLRDDASIIDRIDIALEVTDGSNRLTLARGDLRLGDTHVAYRGHVDLNAFGAPMEYEIELGNSKLSPHGGQQEPVIVDAGKATGSVDLTKGVIDLDEAFVAGKEGLVRAAGDFRWKGIAPGLSGAVTIEETTARMARALWLPVVANKARSWFDQNVKSGLLGPGTVQIALPMQNLGPAGKGRPLPSDGVVGTMPYRYALFTPLRDLPLVRNAFGELQFADATVTVEVDRADVSAAGFGVAGVGQTRFRVPNLGKPDPVGYLNLKMTGPAAAIADLSNAGRLNIAEERGIVPDVLSGNAEVDVSAKFALTKPTRADEIDAEFILNLLDFASAEPIRGQLISSGNLLVAGKVQSYTVKGDARIDGIPADIDLSLGRGKNPSSVRLRMDAEARQKLGIKLESFISGDVIASVDPSSGDTVQEISVDLTPAKIEMPFAGWQKGAGVPANFSAVIDRGGTGTKFRDIVLEGDGFRATADVEVDKNGGLIKLVAKDISLKPGDKFDVTVDGTDEGYVISVVGAAFDARGLINRLLSSSDDAAFADDRYSINVDFGQVRGFSQISMGGVKGTIEASGGQIRSVSLQAQTGTAQPVQLIVEENNARRLVELTSGNGGAVLRFLNVYTKAFGGDLRFRYAGTTSAGEGSLVIDNFRVQNEQVLSEAAKERAHYVDADREIRSTEISIDTANLSFAKLRVPFSKTDGIVTITDGSLRGPAVGGSGKGTVDLRGQNLALSGTIVPAYGVNQIPGAIPILGQLLSGRKREGLIGITYQMFGPLDSPTLKLNPASVIAPGIFRRIFEFN